MDRKGKKRKEREKKVRAKQLRKQQRELGQLRERKRENQLWEQNDEQRERLEGELMIALVDLKDDVHIRAEVKFFLSLLGNLGDIQDVILKNLDELFALAHGKVPHRYTGRTNVELLASETLREMRCMFEALDTKVAPLFACRIGQVICAEEDLDNRLRAICAVKQAEIRAWAVAKGKILDELSDHQGFPRESGEPTDDDTWYGFALGSLLETFIKPMENIRRWQLGVPTDFCRDIVELGHELSVSVTFFLLRQLYQEMTAGELHPILQKQPDSLGMYRFSGVLRLEPEQYLPDPQFTQEQKRLARRLDRLAGGDHAIKALEALHQVGDSHLEAVGKLERLASGQRVFTVVSEMLSASTDWGVFLLQLCCEHPNFIEAYQVLRGTKHSPEQCAHFLCDYGDYRIGQVPLADIIVRLRQRGEAVQLLVEHALYVCCGECASELVALLDDLPKWTKALRYYLSFARSYEPYKQLAVLRHLKHRGVEGLENFIDHLRRQRDDWVGTLLHERDQELFIASVSSTKQPVEVKSHPLQSLASFDLIARYELIAEITELDAETMSQLDAALQLLRGSRYEPIVLGPGRLRQLLMDQLRNNPHEVVTVLAGLPTDGNPYLALKRVLDPSPPSPPQVVEPELTFNRIVLISSAVDPQTTAQLADQLRVTVHVISVDASSNRFNAIRQGDVVVYDTSRTSHTAYYRAKHLAVRRGATFRHASRFNRDALVEIIRT